MISRSNGRIELSVPASLEKYFLEQRTQDDLSDLIDEAEQIIDTYIEHRDRPPESIIDIGCGLGLISAAIHKLTYGCSIILVDADWGGERKAGYGSNMTPYTPHDAIGECMTHNGIPKFDYHVTTPDVTLPPVDLVISTLSWCFHYPPETYRQVLMDEIADMIIVDVRKGQEGLEAFDYEEFAVLIDDHKRRRIAYT